MSHASASVAVALAVAFIAGGCGGSDTEQDPQPAAPAGATGTGPEAADAAAFRAEADELCREFERDLAREGNKRYPELEGAGSPDPQVVARAVDEFVIPRYRDHLEDLRALEAPAEDAAEIEAVYAALERGLDELAADPESAAAGAPPGFREADELAEAYGFDDCGA